jgi:hypothetical protein
MPDGGQQRCAPLEEQSELQLVVSPNWFRGAQCWRPLPQNFFERFLLLRPQVGNPLGDRVTMWTHE